MHRHRTSQTLLAILFAGAVFCIEVNFLFAQTLREQLKSESTQSLASEARSHGNAIRGAILFTSPALACSKCHGAASMDLVGPDLNRLAKDTTDAHLVESLLEPSKKISEGFAMTQLLTEDGSVIVGRLLNESDADLVLRGATGASEFIRVAKVNIAERKMSTTSAMPDNLIDPLKDRGEFLDLVQYVMQLVERQPDSRTMPQTEGGQSISPTLQGLVWLKEYNCGACHDGLPKNLLTSKQAPDLTWSGGAINPQHILQYLIDPIATKPGTTMPDMLAGLDADLRQTAATELTHYIVSLASSESLELDKNTSPTGEAVASTSDSERTSGSDTQTADSESTARGRELFHTVGCVACHAPRSKLNAESELADSVPLGPIDQKYRVQSLSKFLEDPHRVRPSGRMPSLGLSHWEAVDIANYLCSPTSEESVADFRLNAELVARGKARFVELRCTSCHGQSTGETRYLSIQPTRQDRGCLSVQRGVWPRFDLSEQQRQAIRLALTQPHTPLSDDQEISLSLTAFRCLNCHTRNAYGGVSAERSPHFQTSNPNLGPQGYLPPTLTDVGAKLNGKWLREVLISGRSIRPYVKTRMPQFGTDNVAHLVDLFARVDNLPEIAPGNVDDPGSVDEPAQATKIGAKLVGTDGLNCIACHTFQLKEAANMPAVDLTEMAERLQKNWFYHYMLAPQKLSPHTVMPTFWPGGQSMRKDILDGNTTAQIEALWQYLLDGRQAAVPRGLIQEPIRLLATGEAVMLRRSYPEIGKRGIGVGYVGGVNIAFDAEQMRLATIWKGPFADPAGVWRSQGHGTVRPLGDQVIQFPKGPELDNATSAWIVDDGRPPQHQFQGYSLDDQQRPTFRYAFGTVEVEDYFVDAIDAASGQPILRRKLTLVGISDELSVSFRIAVGKVIQTLDEGTYLIDQNLKIRVAGTHRAEVVQRGDDSELRVPLTTTGPRSTLTLEYVW